MALPDPWPDGWPPPAYLYARTGVGTLEDVTRAGQHLARAGLNLDWQDINRMAAIGRNTWTGIAHGLVATVDAHRRPALEPSQPRLLDRLLRRTRFPAIIARRWTVCAYCRKVRRDPTEYCPGCGW